MRFTFLEEGCQCSKDDVFPDGNQPVFVNGTMAAERKLKQILASGQTYWALHVNGRHVLGYHGSFCVQTGGPVTDDNGHPTKCTRCQSH